MSGVYANDKRCKPLYLSNNAVSGHWSVIIQFMASGMERDRVLRLRGIGYNHFSSLLSWTLNWTWHERPAEGKFSDRQICTENRERTGPVLRELAPTARTWDHAT